MNGFSWIREWFNARKTRSRFLSTIRTREELQTDDLSFEKARELIADAFQLQPEIQRRLEGTDELSWIYEGVAGAFSDCMENEILHLSVEKELDREISEDEAKRTATVGDVARLLANHCSEKRASPLD